MAISKNYDTYMDYVQQVGHPNYGLKLLTAPDEVQDYFNELFSGSSDPVDPDDLWRFGYEVIEPSDLFSYVDLDALYAEHEEEWGEPFEGSLEDFVEEAQQSIMRQLEAGSYSVILFDGSDFHVSVPF